MFNTTSKYFFMVSAIAITVGLFSFSNKSNATDCSLILNSPHGDQIYVDATVSWKLDSNFYGGKSYWYGSRDGTLDVNGSDTTLGTFFTQNFGPYPPDSVGHYERFIVIKDWLNQSLCQTSPVIFDIVQPPTSTATNTPSPTATPTPSSTVSPTASPSPEPALAELVKTKLKDGDLIKTTGSFDVWRIKIIGEQKYRQWLFGPQIMRANQNYDFKNVKVVSEELLNLFEISKLISQAGGNGKVYLITNAVSGISAEKSWIPTYEIFQQYGHKFSAVFYVSKLEISVYKNGTNILAPTSQPQSQRNSLLTANLSNILLRFLGLKK